jgi:hypothetical protein
MRRRVLEICVAILLSGFLIACASSPKVERLQGVSLPSVAATPTTLTILDARPPNKKVEESIDTSLGVGKRIDEALISPPPMDSFRVLFQQALLSQDYKQGEATISIQEFGVGTVKGRGAAVNVFGNPGAQGAAAGAGPYGLPAMLIVQLFEQARQDSYEPTYIGPVAKIQMGEIRVTCDGFAVFSEVDASLSWRQSVQKAASNCAAKLLEAENAMKPVLEIKPTAGTSPPVK